MLVDTVHGSETKKTKEPTQERRENLVCILQALRSVHVGTRYPIVTLSGYLGFNKQANTFRSPHENVTQNFIGQQRDLREVCMTRYLLYEVNLEENPRQTYMTANS